MRAIASSIAVGILACGCVVESDPASPCGELDLGEADPATMAAAVDAPLLALAAAANAGDAGTPPFVLHYQCPADAFSSCALVKTDLEELTPGSALMISADGHWVTGIDSESGQISSYEVHRVDGLLARRADSTDYDREPRRLVASLRGSHVMIVRDYHDRLARFNPDPTATRGHVEVIADPELFVAAVGERYIVGRRLVGGGREELYLLPADPEVDGFGAQDDEIPLVRGPAFSRVLLTPGDARVVATSGEGDDAETFVFSVPDAALLDRFSGAAITGRRPLESLPGMRAVSPDGSHVVYRTPNGAIALRNLDTQGACMVRGASAGEHTVAGFSAQAMLYIESETGVGRSHVFVFDPSDRTLDALGEPGDERGVRLAAVPSREPELGVGPWAVGVADGRYFAMQSDGPTSHLGLGDVVFMPRDDEAIWAVNTVRESTGQRRMTVRRIAPTLPVGALHYGFPTGEEADAEYGPNDDSHGTFEAKVRSRLCLSTGVPGSWGFYCGNPAGSNFFAGGNTPPSEDPQGSGDRLEPEVPVLPDDDSSDEP